MITLEQANRIAAAALVHGRDAGLQPLTVAILDVGGNLVALQREDGASNLRPQIAIAKANGALALGVSSRAIGQIAQERPTFVASLAPIAAGGIVPAAGGLLIVDASGTLLGAVGVTGDTSDHDETAAAAAIAAVGLEVRS